MHANRSMSAPARGRAGAIAGTTAGAAARGGSPALAARSRPRAPAASWSLVAEATLEGGNIPQETFVAKVRIQFVEGTIAIVRIYHALNIQYAPNPLRAQLRGFACLAFNNKYYTPGP